MTVNKHSGYKIPEMLEVKTIKENELIYRCVGEVHSDRMLSVLTHPLKGVFTDDVRNILVFLDPSPSTFVYNFSYK